MRVVSTITAVVEDGSEDTPKDNDDDVRFMMTVTAVMELGFSSFLSISLGWLLATRQMQL